MIEVERLKCTGNFFKIVISVSRNLYKVCFPVKNLVVTAKRENRRNILHLCRGHFMWIWMAVAAGSNALSFAFVTLQNRKQPERRRRRRDKKCLEKVAATEWDWSRDRRVWI